MWLLAYLLFTLASADYFDSGSSKYGQQSLESCETLSDCYNCTISEKCSWSSSSSKCMYL